MKLKIIFRNKKDGFNKMLNVVKSRFFSGKTIKNISVILIILFLFPIHNIFSQKTNISYYKHELTFGMGYANGFEKHVFNVPDDISINSAIALNMNYCYFFNKQMGFGVRAFGYYKALPEVSLINSIGTIENISFEMNTYNFDIEYRYLFNRGDIEPYSFLLAGAVYGEVSGNDEKLAINGFNLGAGAGLKFSISERWRLSAELISSFGNAVWESEPFLNSTGDEYNPSMAGVFINISYVFGPKKNKIK
jgi:hypothetical protein